MSFEKFNPLYNAELVLGYLTNMVDKAYDNLPYWLILPNKKPAEAAHCRVDDAELVGSWYEGIDCALKMLNTSEGDEVKQSFRRHLMKSWGAHGLRFHEDYPWTHTNHASFHEMGYILPAMNRITEEYPEDMEAEKRTSELIRGMRALVIERKVRTFWSGDYTETEPLYEFPNDVFLRDGGFDLSRHTGRGEQPIRNAIMLHSLVKRYELKKDEVALDLAIGIANFVLGPSRYFNWKMEFFGHVHSAMWVASGLVYLGRVMNNDTYIEKGKCIYDYVRSLSSDFGWVPEYAQWHPMEAEHCETCCIKDMLQCAHELIKAGYPEYWNDLNLFARNQLVENQITYSGYVTVDNSLPDRDGKTFRDIDKRMIGGFTGGSEPNSISLTRFRSIAGCCVGMAPVALKIAWDDAITKEDDVFVVNIPLDKETDEIILKSFIPDEGRMTVTAKKDSSAAFRLYDWMGKTISYTINGKAAQPVIKNRIAVFDDLKQGDTAELVFPIETVEKKERVRGKDLTVLWRGPDVIDIQPLGEHVRLYQRDLSVPKHYPSADEVEYKGAANYGPTQQGSKK